MTETLKRAPIGLSYLALLRSTPTMFRHEPLLRWRAGIGSLSTATFVPWALERVRAERS